MVAPDEGWLCRQNIERFQRRRADEPDAALRARLTQLIAEEQAKLDRLSGDARMGGATRHPGR